jgi:hypothetical protein
MKGIPELLRFKENKSVTIRADQWQYWKLGLKKIQ